MKTTILFLYAALLCGLFPLLTSCGSGYRAESGNPVRHEEVRHLSGQFSFTEGPAVDKAGNVYFTDQPNNRIWEYDLNGKLSLFMDSSLRSNGMYFDQNDQLISCADEADQLISISKNKQIKVLLSHYNGATFNGPNDVWVAPNSGYYFTDPYYQRDYWQRQAPDPKIKGQYVYYLPFGTARPVIVDDQIQKPNGLVGTPDGKKLYVSDIKANKSYVYDIKPDGTLQNKRLFTNMGLDGMTIDNKGNVYMAGKGVFIFNPEGKQIGHIDIPEDWTANVCFYGKKRNYLFITASKSIYLVKMKNVRGVK